MKGCPFFVTRYYLPVTNAPKANLKSQISNPIFQIAFCLLLSSFSLVPFCTFSQNRSIARGAEPGELYIYGIWYGIYSSWGPPYYDTLQCAIYRLTENGKKLTIQYDVDSFTEDQSEVILADATPGVLYNKRVHLKDDWYTYTQLWTSFDYGKNWVFMEENIGSSVGTNWYYAANVEGNIYRGGGGFYRSEDYGNTWHKIKDNTYWGNDCGLDSCEVFGITGNPPSIPWSIYHTYDWFDTYTVTPINPQYVSSIDVFPDVYRGGLPEEIYISATFLDPENNNKRIDKVSFSSDTGQNFRHVFVSESYNSGGYGRSLFMSDRESGVFYIIRCYMVEDQNPWGEHFKLCIEYYRDYGDTLVATYCHDLTKYYGTTCETVSDLVSEKCNNTCVLLAWSEPESSLPVEGYQIFRNEQLLNEQLTIDTSFFDEDLPVGDYKYYVVTHYTNGCVSDTSNHVKETIEIVTCEPVNNLSSEKCNNTCVLITWSEPEGSLPVEGYHIFRNEQLVNEQLTIDTSFFDEDLPIGEYEYYLVTHYTNGCVSDTSNHVAETIGLGVKELKELGGVRVYPNPTNGEFTINNEQLTINNVEIFDVFGRKVSSHHLISKSSNHKIDISYLHAGIYFVQISTEQGTVTKKVVKY